MEPVTDEYMKDMLGRSRPYTVVLLKAADKRREPGADKLVWEHGRRNFSLRAGGQLAIVCPIVDGSGWAGIGIFTGTPDEVTRIMEEDPGVQAGIFTYEVHQGRGFPGDALPG
ncbi:MAG: hypothetical protein V7637_5630 [Mycobacteriales bacterium]